MRTTGVLTASVLALAAFTASAQDTGELEVTMTVIPEDVELPEAVTRELAIPTDDEGEPRASSQGVENSAAGFEAANAAREDGRAFGQETAAAAQENRESLGRESRPDLEELLPEQVPEVPEIPGPPEMPELPDTPNGPPGQ